jgi:hypothetical protein
VPAERGTNARGGVDETILGTSNDVKRGRARIVLLSGVLVLLIVAAVLARHAVAKFAIERAVGVATGDAVAIADLHLGWSQTTLTGVRVTRTGDPVFDAQRVTVDYVLRDLLPGGHRQFGLVAVDVERPTFTLIRHRDGSYNVGAGSATAAPPAQAATTPLRFAAHVHDGTVRIIDAAPLEPDLAEQTIEDVGADADIDSTARTVAHVDATLVARQTPTAALMRWPIHERSIVDYGRGFAIHRVRAGGIPLRGLLNFVIHAPVARFDDGVLRDVNAFAYAVDIRSGVPFDYRAGGGATLGDGVIDLGPLTKPIRGLGGRLDVYDDGVTTDRLSGTLDGIPLRMRGAVYDFAAPRFRLGVSGDAELHVLRSTFAFLRTQPIAGPMHLETLVTGSVADPLIRTALSSPRAYFGKIPLDDLRGIVDYRGGAVSFSNVHVGFASLHSVVNGLVDVSTPDAAIEAFVAAGGTTSALPYLQELAAGGTLRADALIGGSGKTGFHVRGNLGSTGPDGQGEGFVSVDERGQGEFGPFIFTRRDGSSLAGALRLERPISSSAGWLDARRYRIDIPARAALLPGLSIPGFPAIGGVVDAAIVAGGPPSGFAIAGRARATGARYAAYPLGTIDVELGGTLDDLRLRGIALDGPAGRFRGDGAFDGRLFALTGQYNGSLEQLAPFTGNLDAHGKVSAPVAALIDARGITLQTGGAVTAGASIHGVALAGASGTLAIDGKSLRIIAADADVGGVHAVAATSGAPGTVAISVVGLPAAAVRGAGVPLDAGRLSVFGRANFTGPRFAGTVDLADGSASGYPVAGWADLNVQGGTVTIPAGEAALGTTYASIGGHLAGLGSTAPRYDLTADVPLGDVGAVAHDLRIPLPYVEGSFAARVTAAGSGAAPDLTGSVRVPEGSVNGLSFRDAGGRISVRGDPLIRVDDGHVTVGSTQARFAAFSGPGSLGLRASSNAVDLADFNDYFDQSDLLAGRGPLAVTFSDDGRTTSSTGELNLTGVRVKRYPLGDVAGRWSTPSAGRIVVDLTSSGPAGGLHVKGTIAPAAGDPQAALVNARYDGDVSADALDLGRWLPAAGFSYPILGKLGATEHVSGTFPRLAIGGQASVTGGQVGPYAVQTATLRTHVAGDRIAVDDALIDLGFVRFTALGTAGIARSDPLGLRLHATIPDVAAAIARIAPRNQLNIGGALDVDATIGGTLTAPRVSAGFDFENGQYANVAIPHAIGNLETDLHSLKLDSVDIALTKGNALVAGSLPIVFDPLRPGPPGAPLSLTVQAQDVDLAPFGQFIPGAGTQLGGLVNGRLAVEGTVAAARVLGTLQLANGSYVSSVETSPIRNLNAKLVFAGTDVALEALHADVGNGSLDASGQLDLPVPGAPARGYAITLVAHAATLNFPAYGGGQIDGTAKLSSGRRLPVLSGDVVLTNTTIPFAAIFRASDTDTADTGPAIDLGLNLHASAGKNVRIKSGIIDVGATGDVTLAGTLRAPRATGTFTATRGGYFSTFSRVFRIQDATVTFDPRQGIVPNLDLHASAYVSNPDPDPARNPIGSATIEVAVTGPADGYTITFSSQPQYSQTQILALLSALPVSNFGQSQTAGLLRGAPAPSNVLLPPGVTAYTPANTFSIQNEAVSLLNAQVTQRVLAPLESFLGGGLGLTDLQLTVDYGGRAGFTARQLISKKRDVFVTVGQILSYPTRTDVGLQSRPSPTESLTFSYFKQNGTPYYTNSIFGNTATVEVQNGIQPLSNRQGFSIRLTRSYP